MTVYSRLWVAAFMVPALSSCGGDQSRGRPGDLAGLALEHPRAKVDFTLTATDGSVFDFRRGTRGYVTLLFFGYTHCPDVCPVHLTNIAAALHRIDPEVALRIKVVFVTTDPVRDSLSVIRAWLDHFDPGFVGLRGSLAEVNQIQAQLGQPPAFREGSDSGSAATGYSVAHSAVVLAFTADDSLRVLYPFGIRQADWAADLPRLVAWGKPR
ncbi:MAG TPA: SCO family protein [Gemmatimonadales bacterium]|jgi:protein SCO1/2|nr:SCO family protein [Gemmatimonadales bacterium]